MNCKQKVTLRYNYYIKHNCRCKNLESQWVTIIKGNARCYLCVWFGKRISALQYAILPIETQNEVSE